MSLLVFQTAFPYVFLTMSLKMFEGVSDAEDEEHHADELGQSSRGPFRGFRRVILLGMLF